MIHVKKIYLILLALVTASVMASCAFASGNIEKVRALQDARETIVFVEGTKMGDLVLGSRGKMIFTYVDEAFSRAIVEDRSFLQEWVYDMGQYYGSDATRKKALFMVFVEINKPWDIDITKISVGNYKLTKDDILSSSMTSPFGPQESKTTGYFAFVVPQSELKPGKEVKIGYGDDTELWKVPK